MWKKTQSVEPDAYLFLSILEN